MSDSTKTDLQQGMAAQRPVSDPAVSENLRERVLAPGNRRQAWPQVKAKHGAPGVEGMTSEDFPACARAHGPSSRQAGRAETYHPAPVRRTEVPQRHGQGKRPLGSPTGVARVLQQAMAQVLGPLVAPGFSASSCGFRPGHSAHQGVRQLPGSSNRGSKVAVDLDRAQVFARVSHDALMARGARKVRDKARLRVMGQSRRAGAWSARTSSPRRPGSRKGS
ncbi:MAG TPA: reverse transcriptase domain-containing protein [Candidatus Binatia bacterium]|nr:reverse transcriptase domain-containing protein [Candidatus Binatia bacterium]